MKPLRGGIALSSTSIIAQTFVESRVFTIAIVDHTAGVRRDDDLAGLADVAPATVIAKDRAGDLHVSQAFMELLGPWERWLDRYVSGRINVTPASVPLESRKSFGEFSDSVKTEGNNSLTSTVNEPFASMLLYFEESICLGGSVGMLAAPAFQALYVPRSTGGNQRPLRRDFASRTPAVVDAIVGAFAFTEVVSTTVL
jgi:hypothetical protein